MGKEITIPFKLGWDIIPVKFYPYKSCVLDRLFEMDCLKELSGFYQSLERGLVFLFNSRNIEAHEDNKIAFEVKTKVGKSIYIGFYDWILSIGFQVEYEGQLMKPET